MPPLISAEALFGAGMMMLLIGTAVAAGAAVWALWRVLRWIMTGRV